MYLLISTEDKGIVKNTNSIVRKTNYSIENFSYTDNSFNCYDFSACVALFSVTLTIKL